MTTVATSTGARSAIRWGRIIGLAFALEAALFAVLLPIQPLMSKTAWVACVTIACAAFGLATGWVCARGLASRAVLHGALTGALATIIYLLINVSAGGIGAAAAFYGWPLFVVLNALRIAGCTAGAALPQTRA